MISEENDYKVKCITRGDLAKRSGCNLETIRYYERIGLLPDPRPSRSGYRQYSSRHEQRLRFILRGRELGFSTDELRGLLDLVDRRAVTCAQVKSIAQQHLASVRAKIADLRDIERVLSATVGSCSGDAVPECPLIDVLFADSRVAGKAG